jgi:hypothetical protein
MIFSENRYPLFGIMLRLPAARVNRCGTRGERTGLRPWLRDVPP